MDFAARVMQYSWHPMYTGLETNPQVFRAALSRYFRFLGLLNFGYAVHPSEFPCLPMPLNLALTLDIDLVWRTHLLSWKTYSKFSDNVYRKILPHARHHSDVDIKPTASAYEVVFQKSTRSVFAGVVLIRAQAGSPLAGIETSLHSRNKLPWDYTAGRKTTSLRDWRLTCNIALDAYTVPQKAPRLKI
ncbi:Fc.00g059370.m01.CDS01 [Cosmosporella sp. VM-42]